MYQSTQWFTKGWFCRNLQNLQCCMLWPTEDSTDLQWVERPGYCSPSYDTDSAHSKERSGPVSTTLRLEALSKKQHLLCISRVPTMVSSTAHRSSYPQDRYQDDLIFQRKDSWWNCFPIHSFKISFLDNWVDPVFEKMLNHVSAVYLSNSHLGI